MDFHTRYLQDAQRLITLKNQADVLLQQYHDNQFIQLVHRQNMKIRRYKFVLDQIIQKEKLAYLQFEKKMDTHVSMLSSTLLIELLPDVDQYVDKLNEWQKTKQSFLQEYETVTSLSIIQNNFFHIECNNLTSCQHLEMKHLSELNKLHLVQMDELNQTQFYQDFANLNKQQNVEISHLLYYQQNNNDLLLEQMKKEEELALVISKIQVKDQLPPFEEGINMLENEYRYLHCEISSIPEINYNISCLEEQTIVLEEIYYQFYSIQLELIKAYPKMEKAALDIRIFFEGKNIEWQQERTNFLDVNPRVLF